VEFSPKSIIDWYKKWPTWAKVAGAVVFVVLLLLAVAAFVLTFGGKLTGRGGPDPLSTAIDVANDNAAEEMNAAHEQDAELADKIDEAEEKVDDLDAESREAARERDDAHEAVNDADSIAGIRDALRDRRRR
jgi:hypothetical protein